jgi:hypothetical protein
MDRKESAAFPKKWPRAMQLGRELLGVRKREEQLPNRGTRGHARLAAPAGGNAEHGRRGRYGGGGRLRVSELRRWWARATTGESATCKEVGVASPFGLLFTFLPMFRA